MENFILTKKQERQFLQRITRFISNRLEWITTEKYDLVEIHSLTGVGQNRLSELLHYEKYLKNIAKPDLQKLIGGGIVTIREIENEVVVSKKESDYLHKNYSIYGNKKLLDRCNKAFANGIDLVEEIDKLFEAKGII